MKTSRTIIDPGGLGKSLEPRLSRVGRYAHVPNGRDGELTVCGEGDHRDYGQKSGLDVSLFPLRPCRSVSTTKRWLRATADPSGFRTGSATTTTASRALMAVRTKRRTSTVFFLFCTGRRTCAAIRYSGGGETSIPLRCCWAPSNRSRC